MANKAIVRFYPYGTTIIPGVMKNPGDMKNYFFKIYINL
jgi:hypothetical protein